MVGRERESATSSVDLDFGDARRSRVEEVSSVRVGVVVPSRLSPRPGGRVVPPHGPELWVDGALASVLNQSGYSGEWRVFVGVDPGAVVPDYLHRHARVVRGSRAGQSAAVNAAARAAAAASDVLLFLEDDDVWHPWKTMVQLPYLDQAPFVSCSQRLVSEDRRTPLGANDYPVPSGWAMESDVWRRVGGFAESFRWLVDSEWLGRLGAAKVKRVHLVPGGKVHQPNRLDYVARSSIVARYAEGLFLVDRTINTQGGLATVHRGAVAGEEAALEASELHQRYGCDPW